MNSIEAYSLLANHTRQSALRELYEGDGASTVADLSHQITIRDGDASADERESIQIRLVHHHLPKLEDHGIIEYDQKSGDIALTDNGEDLKPLLKAAAAFDQDHLIA